MDGCLAGEWKCWKCWKLGVVGVYYCLLYLNAHYVSLLLLLYKIFLAVVVCCECGVLLSVCG